MINPDRARIVFNPQRPLGALLLGVASGGAAGLAAGAAARLAMRAVAVLSGQTPGFTVEGTLFILVVFAVMGAWLGVVYAVLRPLWPGSPRAQGAALGAALALLAGVPVLFIRPTGELALLPREQTAALVASVPLLYGIVLGLAAARLAPPGATAGIENPRFSRAAGLLAMPAALAAAALYATLAFTHPAIYRLGFGPAQALERLASVSLVLACLAGLAGLARSGALGASLPGRLGLSAALLTLGLLGMPALFGEAGPAGLNGLVGLLARARADGAALLALGLLGVTVLGALAAGAAALRARRWPGWRAYAPLAAGLFPVVCVLLLHPGLFPRLAGLSFPARNALGYWLGVPFALSWLALGVALRGEARPASEAPAGAVFSTG
jgi:hypothetical protein